MKKLLLGVIIAVIMIGISIIWFGNGFSKKLISTVECDALFEKSNTLSLNAIMNDIDYYKRYGKTNTDVTDIKRAHYWAVTWSALCD